MKRLGSRSLNAYSDNRKSKIQNLKWLALSALLFALSLPAQAQQPKKIPRIGYLSASSAAEALSRTEAFRRGLRELGYVEGENIVVEFLYADGKFDRLPALAVELVQLAPDLIWLHSTPAAVAVKQATTAIPVVIAVASSVLSLTLLYNA